MKTLGEISKSHGFDNPSDFVNEINNKIDDVKKNSFIVGEFVKLKSNYVPTHFNEEKILPVDGRFLVKEKSGFTLDQYNIKFDGYDSWFSASVFERTTLINR